MQPTFKTSRPLQDNRAIFLLSRKIDCAGSNNPGNGLSMAREEDDKRTPSSRKRRDPQGGECFVFSPGFRSMAEMAGWDEESIIIASLTVEDTPDQQQTAGSKRRRRSNLNSKTPPVTDSRRKRGLSVRSPIVVPLILSHDEFEDVHNKKLKFDKVDNQNCITLEESEKSPPRAIPCLDSLREELSCAICLEICYEPSTTPCGHSFCKKCLRSAADKCGKKCPKCRQLISNGRSCAVNTVLWNTIKLLFPKEVAARQEMASRSGRDSDDLPSDSRRASSVGNIEEDSERRRRPRNGPAQDEDAALALRLQREEFMEAFQGSNNSVSVGRANLRAMASAAIRNRMRAVFTARTTRSHRRH